VSTEIAIVGSGFSGLGTAIRLKQRGYEDFVDLGAGERRRRYVAGQHLSRLQVRHPFTPVLVLVRAEPRLA
jgi:cation diffusion facilitator CzcD-associated flavoprotein CzcO